MSANQRSTAPPFKEEFATVLRMTHSLNDAQPVPATPASFCNPTNCNIGCDDVVQNQKNENETPPATQIQKPNEEDPSKRHLNRLKNWYVIRKERKIANRFRYGTYSIKMKFDSYFHKETGFRCRSLKEIKNYEKYGSPPRRHKVKTQAKEESNDKPKMKQKKWLLLKEKQKQKL
ncbi:hypothetical protein GYH30_024589 [Glycine max]|nr:hypothetical protein GYH30_024589 [Glycine max]